MPNIPNAGAIVVIKMRGYEHYAIVSDRFDYDGWPMLISLSQRLGTVAEESWHSVTQGYEITLSTVTGELDDRTVLQRARTKIGIENYNGLLNNCENFARWTHDLAAISRQVIAPTVGGATGLLIAKACKVESKLGIAALVLAGGIVGWKLSSTAK